MKWNVPLGDGKPGAGRGASVIDFNMPVGAVEMYFYTNTLCDFFGKINSTTMKQFRVFEESGKANEFGGIDCVKLR